MHLQFKLVVDDDPVAVDVDERRRGAAVDGELAAGEGDDARVEHDLHRVLLLGHHVRLKCAGTS